MKKLALREVFSDTKSKLYQIQGNCYYVAGRLYDAESLQMPQFENRNLALATIPSMINPLTRYFHNHFIDSTMEKAAAGDYAERPSDMDAIKGVAQILSQQVQRAIPYINQTLRTQLSAKNNFVAAAGVVTLLGFGAYIVSTTSREDLEGAVRQTTYDVALAANKIEDKLSKTAENMPAYTLNKINV